MIDWIKKKLGLAENFAGAALGDCEDLIHRPLYPIHSYFEVVQPGVLARGSWPDVRMLSSLREVGVRTVINLCAERGQDAQVMAAKMRPVNIPVVDNTVPTERQLDQFLDTVIGLGSAFVHCEAGIGRTSCCVAAFRVRVQLWATSEALAEARAHGLRLPCQEDFIRKL
jgi:hypothetical protein